MLYRLLPITVVLIAAACGHGPHTIENTEHLSQAELADLCEDLQMRATMDCRWNMREQQSTVADQQTWEINCRARQDSAQQSFDNVCEAWRLQPANPDGNDQER